MVFSKICLSKPETTILKKTEEGEQGSPAINIMSENKIPERAVLEENVDLGDSDELLYFHLRSKETDFTMGLSDILACLKFAEKEGMVPELSEQWWDKMYGVYPELQEPLEVSENENEEI